MLPHSELGTQRLELPVSRTTLNSWGGVPRAIVLKSAEKVSYDISDQTRYQHTLRVEEILNRDWVQRSILIFAIGADGDLSMVLTHQLGVLVAE